MAPSGVGSTNATTAASGVDHRRGPDEALLARDEEQRDAAHRERQDEGLPAERERAALRVQHGDDEDGCQGGARRAGRGRAAPVPTETSAHDT